MPIESETRKECGVDKHADDDDDDPAGLMGWGFCVCDDKNSVGQT